MTTTERPLKHWLIDQAVQAAIESDKAFRAHDSQTEGRALGRQEAFTMVLARTEGVSLAEATEWVLISLP